MSQIRCGALRANPNKTYSGPVLLGSRLDGVIELIPIERTGRESDEAPDFDVFYKRRGAMAPAGCGGAWLKNHSRVGDFLSITMDDPDWSSPLNLTAFPPRNSGGDWQVVWSRPRGARVQEAA